MEMRRIGNSDLIVSVFGMGCWQFGGGSYWGGQDQKDVDSVVSMALDQGINYFDTAEVYNDGESEKSLGLALKGKRGRAIIGTKINPANTQPSVLREHCEASLRRLQTDYIDLYMLHWPINAVSIAHYTGNREDVAKAPTIQEIFDTLVSLQKEGKIRNIGISNHGVEQMKEVEATGARIAANQLHYNLLSRAIEDTVLPYCVDHSIGVIGYMGLLQGILSGGYRSLDDIPALRVRTRHFHHSRGEGSRHGDEGAEAEVMKALTETQTLADELGVSMGKLALAWAFSNPDVKTTICGSRNLKQLEDNLAAANFKLTADAIVKLNQISDPLLKKLGSNADYWESTENSRIR
jgi:myo-inositol catabolism protein IolS